MEPMSDASAKDSDDLVLVSIEAWKFIRLLQRAVSRLEPSEQARYVSQARFFQKKIDGVLEARGIRLESIEGHPFEPGLAATALNSDEFVEGDRALFIAQMIEPIVIGPEGVIKTGTFILGAV